MLDFKEWQATKTKSYDLNGDLYLRGCGRCATGRSGDRIEGFIYGDSDIGYSWLLPFKDAGNQRYELNISNGSWVSDNIKELEDVLYHDWAKPNMMMI